MQGGRHIGKIIVNMPEDSSSLESSKYQPTTTLRPDRTYLLVGGLGGLGRSVATWMVEQGARHITFLSRSAKLDESTEAFVNEMSSQGCDVQLAQGSVANRGDVQRAVDAATMPIAGVVNLSMVLRVSKLPVCSCVLVC
jgi:NAD(P)-dependent dehydrogenase (short-subunit alcohol dehydrogenase family)